MTSTAPAIPSFVKEIGVFAGLDADEIASVFGEIEERSFDAGENLIRENEPVNCLFIVLDGRVEILKNATDETGEYRISELGRGDVIGDMSLIEDLPASATARCLTPTRLLLLHIDDICSRSDFLPIHNKMISNVSREISQRLRYTNEVTVKRLTDEIDASNVRISLGIFVVTVLALFPIYTLSLSALTFIKQYLTNTLPISSMVLVLFGLGILYTMKKSAFPLTIYGLHFRDWKKVVRQAILYSIPVCALLLVLKWVAITTIPAFEGEPLFDPTSTFRQAGTRGAEFDISTYLITMALYALLSPVQEFIVRSGLQTSFHRFLPGTEDRRKWIAIVISNLMFSSVHAHTSFGFALASFIPGLFWGWLYARQWSLIGVSVSHIFIGIWAIFILGFTHLI